MSRRFDTQRPLATYMILLLFTNEAVTVSKIRTASMILFVEYERHLVVDMFC